MDENLINDTQNEDGNGNQVYIDTINEIKANSVSKEKYDQLVKERDGLVEALKSGEQVNLVNPEKEVDIDELRNDLYGDPDKAIPWVEYFEKSLKLRDALIERGEQDPMIPRGSDYEFKQSDEDQINADWEQIREILEYAQGDNQAFINELARRMPDDTPLQKAIRGQQIKR